MDLHLDFLKLKHFQSNFNFLNLSILTLASKIVDVPLAVSLTRDPNRWILIGCYPVTFLTSHSDKRAY